MFSVQTWIFDEEKKGLISRCFDWNHCRRFKNVYILGVTARPEKIFVQNSGNGNSANESSVSNDEPEYLVPIGDDIQF